ncbi:MAG: phage holin family protein [Thiohalomonadaceae bacterium]
MKNSDKPITGLLSDLARETSDLVQTEVRLAKAELSEKINQVNSGLVSLISGGVVVFVGLLFLLQAVTIVLAQLLEPVTQQPWVAPLIVGLIVAIIGVVLLQKGRHNLKAEALVPKRTAESLRHDRDLLREQYK